MKMRSLTISDYNQIVALWHRAGLPYKPKGRDGKKTVQAEMEAHPDFFIGAFDDNKLAGVIIVTCDGRKGWLNRLAVDPDCRRKGVAKALIIEAEKVLRRHGMKIFCALIEDYNSASMELFKKCGYVEHRDIIYFSKRDTSEV